MDIALTFLKPGQMKWSFKQKLFLYFFVVFSIFTIGIIVFARAQERQLKTEALEEKLNAYTQIAHRAYSEGQNLDSIVQLLPKEIRITLINDSGKVQYDNILENLSGLDNHSERPEIIQAKMEGTGTDIRTSSSNSVEYLYYVKYYEDFYLRVALPYDIQVQHFLKPDNLFLYFIIALFLGMLVLINLIASRFGGTIKKLRDFALSSDKELNNPANKFPQDELGEISEKIVENYKQLQNNKRKISLEREKLLQHVHSLEEGICFFSKDGKVEFYNGLFIQYLNIISDTAKGNPQVVFSEPLFKELNVFLASDQQESNFETHLEKHSKHFSLRANIFDDQSFEIILNDITKQKKTQLLKQEMTGNIAHELRTPVTSIRGYLETVLENPVDADKKQQFLTKAYKQVLVLSELIQDMGLITKIEGSPTSFEFSPVNLSNILKDLKYDLSIALREKGIEMEYDIPKNLAVRSNKNLLYSIFRNLTDNVIRYAGSNVKITIGLYDEDAHFYYFLYSDTGKGIDNEKHLNRLFERFYRINEGRSRDSGGSGLGLSIVKNAISLHKGTINVKNRKGGGLEFLIKLQK